MREHAIHQMQELVRYTSPSVLATLARGVKQRGPPSQDGPHSLLTKDRNHHT